MSWIFVQYLRRIYSLWQVFYPLKYQLKRIWTTSCNSIPSSILQGIQEGSNRTFGPSRFLSSVIWCRSEAFQLHASYTEDSDIPSGMDKNIATWTIGAPKPTKNGAVPKLKIRLTLSLHGLVTLDSVTQVEEEEYEEIIKRPVPAKVSLFLQFPHFPLPPIITFAFFYRFSNFKLSLPGMFILPFGSLEL